MEDSTNQPTAEAEARPALTIEKAEAELDQIAWDDYAFFADDAQYEDGLRRAFAGNLDTVRDMANILLRLLEARIEGLDTGFFHLHSGFEYLKELVHAEAGKHLPKLIGMPHDAEIPAGLPSRLQDLVLVTKELAAAQVAMEAELQVLHTLQEALASLLHYTKPTREGDVSYPFEDLASDRLLKWLASEQGISGRLGKLATRRRKEELHAFIEQMRAAQPAQD